MAIKNITENQYGFSLMEIIMVLVIVGILAMIAFPSYLNYLTRTNRGDMMTELQNRANILEGRKMAEGSYGKLKTSDKNLIDDLELEYPATGTALYTVKISPTPLTSEWMIIAKPKTDTIMENDGTLSLNFQGIKCRNTSCGLDKEWQDDEE